MQTRRMFLASSAALATVPGLTSAARGATPANTLVMAIVLDGIITGFDPGEAYDFAGWEVCGNVYQTLVTPTPADPTKLVGDIAERWEVSPDGLNFTFKLRSGLKFESGRPVTADDVVFSLQRVIRLNKAGVFLLGQFGWTTDNIEALIKAPDPQTVTLTLPTLFATDLVLYCLSTLTAGVVDKAAALANEVNGDLGNKWLKTHSAGSGPYRLAEWQPGQYVTLETNPVSPNKPKIPRLIMRHVADPATQFLILQKGDVDIARNLGADQIKLIAGQAGLTTVIDPLANVITLYTNMSLPQFQKLEVRQAVKKAVDYEAIAKNIVPDLWSVWQSCIPKGIPGAITDMPWKKDVPAAKALMAKAGYADGFSVTLDHFSTSPYADIAQAVQANLAEIGIKAQLLAGETKQVVSKAYARTFQMMLASPGSDYLDGYSLAQYFCENRDDSDASKNQNPAWRNHWIDPALNDLVAQAAKETNTTKRLEVFADIQKGFMERSPMAILLQQNSVAGVRKSVFGFHVGSIAYYTRFGDITKT
jgi:peptide/nickel transport system substrate-binding protein